MPSYQPHARVTQPREHTQESTRDRIPHASNPVVLIAPAMAIGSHFYGPVVEEFKRHGWSARTLPRRGFEREKRRAARNIDWCYQDEIDDMRQAVAQARGEEPSRPLILLGHSLGAQLAAGHELNGPPSADGFVSVGGTIPYHRLFPLGGIDLLLMAGLVVPALTAVFGYLPKPAFGAPGARTLMREWAHMVLTGQPPYPVQRRIATPSLLVSLDRDTLCPAGAVDTFALNLFEQDSVTRWHCTREVGEAETSIDHIRWVRTPTTVVSKVVAWWQDHADRPQATSLAEIRGTASEGARSKPSPDL